MTPGPTGSVAADAPAQDRHTEPGPAAGTIEGLYVYPFKGLSPQRLTEVTLEAGRGFPLDRGYALARADGLYRPDMPGSLSKFEYFMLAKNARLAGLSTWLDSDGKTFTVRVRDHLVLECDLSSDEGRRAAQDFFARVLDCPDDLKPVIAASKTRRFTDAARNNDEQMNAISVINLASVRELADRIEAPIDPLRFRANLYIDGLPAFAEADLVGREFTVGTATVRGIKPTVRCPATEVNPANAHRDLPIPRLLAHHFGHTRLGIYITMLSGTTLRPGDPIRLPRLTPEESDV